MKILLIQPKMNKRPMDTDLKTRMSPSLALLTLLSLTPDGHETIVCNENVEKIATSSTEPSPAVGINVIKKLCDPSQMKYSNLLHLGTTG
jgi:hypothetical protein